MEEELGPHAVSPVRTKALFTKQKKANVTATEESEHLRDALEASQKEWEDSERRKLDLAQAKQPAKAKSTEEMDAMMRRLSPAENGAAAEASAALAGLLSTAT